MNKMSRKPIMISCIGVICFFLLIIVLRCFVVVDAGQVGVLSTFGSVSDRPIYPGIRLKNPFSNVISFSTRTSEYTMSIDTNEGKKLGDDSIQALTNDGATVWLDVTVLYHVIPESAPGIYKNLGTNFEESLVRPEIRSTIREKVSLYGVSEIYSTKREELNSELNNALKEALKARGIEVEDVLLRNINLTQTLSDSIEQKLAAQQEAQKLDYVLEKEEKEAQRKVIEAQGQRDAQAIINESLSDKYLYYLYINVLKDLKGVIYVPTEGGLPLFKNVE